MKIIQTAKVTGIYKIRMYDRQRRFIKQHRFENLVPNSGLNYLRDVAILNAVAKITEWRFMPIAASPTIVATDNYETHPGWEEFEDYVEATRQICAFYADTINHGWSKNDDFEAEITFDGDGTLGGMATVGGGVNTNVKGDHEGNCILLSAAPAEEDVEFEDGFVAQIRMAFKISRAS